MRAPGFWNHDGWLARTLTPLSTVVAASTRRRVACVGWRAPIPVICCGNATVGGAGKTTLALDLARRLTMRGIAVHILSRGYRGAARGSHRVTPRDTAAVAGDEALLLARVAPTWTGADRADSARDAIAAGAEVLLMDDGLQNPTLMKTMSLLVVDGTTGFGNGRVMPAGPLREPVEAAASRCRAAVVIGPDSAGAQARLPARLPVLHADLVQSDEIAGLIGRRVVAFAGIAHPEKFFLGLERAGVLLVRRVGFADHHVFSAGELADLHARAKAADAILVTTPKDAVRLPAQMPVQIVGVRLIWKSEAAIEALLDELTAAPSPIPAPRPGSSMA